MQNKLLEKYLDFKVKSLVSYGEILYRAYTDKETTLWTTKKEFRDILEVLIKVFINEHHLKNRKLQEVEKLNTKDLEMSKSLKIVKDYYGNNYEIHKTANKRSLFYLITTLYTITKLDKEITFYKSNSVTVENIAGKLRKLIYEEIDILELNDHAYIIEDLANKIKDCERKERKFFKALKSEESYNLFKKIESDYFEVEYFYEPEIINKYKQDDIKKVYQKNKIADLYTNISFEELVITTLKLFSNDCIVPKFIIPISIDYLKKEKNLQYLDKLYNNEFIKEHFLIGLNNQENYNEVIEVIKNKGIKIAICLKEKIEKSTEHFTYLEVSEKQVKINEEELIMHYALEGRKYE